MNNLPVPGDAQFVIYQTEDGQTRVQVRLEGETIWLTQKQMAELFQTTIANVNIHLKNLVRSHRGTQFRQWATGVLSEYVVKGFVLDDDRLKEIRNIGSDYFDELLERLRDIRVITQQFFEPSRTRCTGRSTAIQPPN